MLQELFWASFQALLFRLPDQSVLLDFPASGLCHFRTQLVKRFGNFASSRLAPGLSSKKHIIPFNHRLKKMGAARRRNKITDVCTIRCTHTQSCYCCKHVQKKACSTHILYMQASGRMSGIPDKCTIQSCACTNRGIPALCVCACIHVIRRTQIVYVQYANTCSHVCMYAYMHTHVHTYVHT